MSAETKLELIAERNVEGAYGLSFTEAIIDHPKHGRIYICEEWGGNSLEGECYRWKHGWIISVPSDADFAFLDADSNWEHCGETISRLAALKDALEIDGCELMPWINGFAVGSIARSAGL